MLNYRRAGSGPSLVLIHGFVGGGAYWTQTMGEFCRSRDVIAIDLPGFAGSGHSPVQTSLAGFGEALFDHLDSLSVETFALVGHSMGGMIAQEMAAARPDRIDRLILYGSASTGDLPGRFEGWKETIERFQEKGVSASIDRISSSWFVEETSDPAFPSCRAGCDGATLEACVAALGAIQAWDFTDRVSQLGMPTLVVVGEHDRSTAPAESMNLWRRLPDARFCILPGCAHAAHLEKPHLFNSVLADFLLAAG